MVNGLQNLRPTASEKSSKMECFVSMLNSIMLCTCSHYIFKFPMYAKLNFRFIPHIRVSSYTTVMESDEEEVGDRELSARWGPSCLKPCKDVVFGNDMDIHCTNRLVFSSPKMMLSEISMVIWEMVMLIEKGIIYEPSPAEERYARCHDPSGQFDGRLAEIGMKKSKLKSDTCIILHNRLVE